MATHTDIVFLHSIYQSLTIAYRDEMYRNCNILFFLFYYIETCKAILESWTDDRKGSASEHMVPYVSQTQDKKLVFRVKHDTSLATYIYIHIHFALSLINRR